MRCQSLTSDNMGCLIVDRWWTTRLSLENFIGLLHSHQTLHPIMGQHNRIWTLLIYWLISFLFYIEFCFDLVVSKPRKKIRLAWVLSYAKKCKVMILSFQVVSQAWISKKRSFHFEEWIMRKKFWGSMLFGASQIFQRN